MPHNRENGSDTHVRSFRAITNGCGAEYRVKVERCAHPPHLYGLYAMRVGPEAFSLTSPVLALGFFICQFSGVEDQLNKRIRKHRQRQQSPLGPGLNDSASGLNVPRLGELGESGYPRMSQL